MEHKSSFQLIFSLFVSLFLFFSWWGLHSSKPLDFRGVGVEGSLERQTSKFDLHYRYAFFYKDLPSGFRPFASWAVLGVKTLIVEPMLNIFARKYKDFGVLPIEIASSLVTALNYILVFLFLSLSFKSTIGFLALLGFGLIPFTTHHVGLVHHDSFVLLFWTIYLKVAVTFLYKIEYKHPIINKYIIYSLLMAMIASWIMENIGIAFSIALFILAVTKKYHGPDKPYWRMYFSAVVGTLLALAISWVLCNRHPDVFWTHPGMGIESTWKVYSKHDRLLDLFEFSIRIIATPVLFVGFASIILAVFGNRFDKKPNPHDYHKHYILIWFSGAALIGFFCTALAGLWMGAGFRNEWPRQLLPLSLLFTWFAFNIIVYAIRNPFRKQQTRQ